MELSPLDDTQSAPILALFDRQEANAQCRDALGFDFDGARFTHVGGRVKGQA